jgi:FemAB-related protein (PEP-CTERM system-associated)
MGSKLIVVSELTDHDCDKWDTYVKGSVRGLPHHLSGWRTVLRESYGYETPYLIAREDERVVGVLPLFVVRSLLVGNVAMTMPGGLCADTQEVAQALIAQGKEVAHQAKAKRFLLHDTRQVWPGNLHTSTKHVHWVLDVRPDTEALWQALDGNIRRQVRIARRKELSVEVDRTGKHLAAFYEVLSQFAHQVGTPLFGYDFLEHIVKSFPDGFNIVVVYQGQQPIGGYFQLEMGRTVYGVWGATLRDYLQLRAVYLAYWEIIRDASANGFHHLDMGRSPAHSEASRYKGQWGGVASPIYQQVAHISSGRHADSIADQIQSEGKFQLVMQLWPKLPLPVAQYLGPKLRRHVPFA